MSDAKMLDFVNRLMPLYDNLIALAQELRPLEEGLARELGLPPVVTYFAQAGGHRGPVKIGRTRNLKARLSALQTGSGDRLKVIRTIPFDCEHAVHLRFADCRRHREWFEFDIDMLTETFNEPLLGMARARLAEAA